MYLHCFTALNNNSYWKSSQLSRYLTIEVLTLLRRKSKTGRCAVDCGCEQKYKWHRLLAYDPDNDCKGK